MNRERQGNIRLEDGGPQRTQQPLLPVPNRTNQLSIGLVAYYWTPFEEARQVTAGPPHHKRPPPLPSPPPSPPPSPSPPPPTHVAHAAPRRHLAQQPHDGRHRLGAAQQAARQLQPQQQQRGGQALHRTARSSQVQGRQTPAAHAQAHRLGGGNSRSLVLAVRISTRRTRGPGCCACCSCARCGLRPCRRPLLGTRLLFGSRLLLPGLLLFGLLLSPQLLQHLHEHGGQLLQANWGRYAGRRPKLGLGVGHTRSGVQHITQRAGRAGSPLQG